MVYLYAVRRGAGAEPRGSGLEDRPLRTVSAAGLTAVVSDHGDARPPAQAEFLWRHERVVEDLMADGAVLPMRYGSVLAGDAAVAELLRDRAGELDSALARVAGAVEVGVRVAWRAADTPGDTPARAGAGADYLDRLLDRRRRAGALAERIDGPLRALARAGRHRLLVTDHLPFSGAYLVGEERLDAFRSRVVALEQGIGDAEMVCTGPWPPYSFVGGGAEDAPT